MRFLCFGVGAIGSYIGGSLALAGHTVVFVERPAVAEEVRQRGLHLRLKTGEKTIRDPQVVETLESALGRGPFDAAILAVKSFDTGSVIDMIRPFKDQFPPVLSFQNGVENEPELARLLGTKRVITCTVTTAIGRKGAGDIVVERLRGIGVATNHSLGAQLVPILDEAGLRARGYPNPAAMKWSKMLTNLIANATSAILDMTPAQIFADPRTYKIEIRQLREMLKVMKVQNIPVVNLPGTPSVALAWAVTALPLAVSRPLLIRSVGAGRGGKMPSFHIDLYAGRTKSEVEYLNGAVTRYGIKFHVATPVNDTLCRILMAIAQGEIAIEEYAHQPEKLIAQIPPE